MRWPLDPARLGTPQLETTFRIAGHGNAWQVIRVRRWVRPSGDIAKVSTRVCKVVLTERLARFHCAELNAEHLAREADILSDAMAEALAP